ncbi:MAG: DNA-binding NtrC family response regulator [Gammaproteobacteria bacterium]|jgi:DNA-binding NtrC family response regulator
MTATTVVLIDDSPSLSTLYRAHLAKVGYSLQSFENGTEEIAFLESDQGRYCVTCAHPTAASQ